MSRLVALVAALAVLLFASAAGAAEVSLYTFGPGDYLFARYGHSLLCVDAKCFDYGIPDREGAVHMSWASIRGEPIFVAIAVDEAVAVKAFRDQGRSIERQKLPLSDEESAKLRERLERDVAMRAAYAYHPYFANCTTQLRDRIDEATNGRLRPGKSGEQPVRFRDLSEEGLSGRLFELTALAFTLGGPAERKPTAWEAMFLPEGLRDGVADRFAAAPEKVEPPQRIVLPTSRAVGRIALAVIAFALSGLVRWTGREKKRARIGFVVAAIVLGGMALVADGVAALVVWPEFRRNCALAARLPKDLAMPGLSPRASPTYATARAALAGVLAVLEIVGVIEQPLLHVCLLVALPMIAIASVARTFEVARDRSFSARATPLAEATVRDR